MAHMYKVGLLSVFLVTMLGLSGQAQATFYDLYSGMLKKQGDQLVLSKCGTVSADFILKFANDKLKRKLPDLAVNKLVELHVKGEAKVSHGKYYLVVHEIDSIRTGSSCNLLDSLNKS